MSSEPSFSWLPQRPPRVEPIGPAVQAAFAGMAGAFARVASSFTAFGQALRTAEQRHYALHHPKPLAIDGHAYHHRRRRRP